MEGGLPHIGRALHGKWTYLCPICSCPSPRMEYHSGGEHICGWGEIAIEEVKNEKWKLF